MRGFDDPRGRQSEQLAFEAERAMNAGELDAARGLFAQAAELEEKVVADTDSAEPRVKSVLAVSAVALWYKAHRLTRAQILARHYLTAGVAVDGESVRELRALIRNAQQARGSGGQSSTFPVANRSDVAQRYCEVRDEIEWRRATVAPDPKMPAAVTAELERLWAKLDDEDRLAIEHEVEALEMLERTGEFLCADVELDKVEESGPRVARASQ